MFSVLRPGAIATQFSRAMRAQSTILKVQLTSLPAKTLFHHPSGSEIDIKYRYRRIRSCRLVSPCCVYQRHAVLSWSKAKRQTLLWATLRAWPLGQVMAFTVELTDENAGVCKIAEYEWSSWGSPVCAGCIVPGGD